MTENAKQNRCKWHHGGIHEKQEVIDILESLGRSRESFRYELRDLFEVIPTMTAADAPVVREVSAAVEQVLGKPAEFVVSPGTYDQKHFDRIGRIHNCIAYGPGILDLAHQVSQALQIYYQGGLTPAEAAQAILLASQVLALGFIGGQV